MSLFTEIEKHYGWILKETPADLNGGFTHKMYRLKTERGDYALKVLNRFIMQRETAMANYIRAENLEHLLEQKGIPVLPALLFNGKKMQELNGEYFYLFDYYPGTVLDREEITEYHCAEIGKALAKIHRIDKKPARGFSEMKIDWDFYLAEAKQANVPLYEMLRENHSLIIESQNNGNLAKRRLPGISAVCHNDMDRKNVLWNGADYRIIDLECLSYNNPFLELFELALCWSGYEECQLNFRLFQSFIQGYAMAGGELPVDWSVLYDCNNGRLEWLEYNLKRVLGIGCGADEKEIGMKQAKETIKQIVYYAKAKAEILENCARNKSL